MQKPRLTAITAIDVNVERALESFLSETKQLPKNILIFRGGVSEGEFRSVQDEAIAVQDMLPKFGSKHGIGNYNPSVCWLVVQVSSHRHSNGYVADEVQLSPSPGQGDAWRQAVGTERAAGHLRRLEGRASSLQRVRPRPSQGYSGLRMALVPHGWDYRELLVLCESQRSTMVVRRSGHSTTWRTYRMD